jgi:hypothetical protein
MGHRQNRQPRQDLSSTRPGNFSKQTVSQRGRRRDGIVRTNFTVALRAVFTRLYVLFLLGLPMLAPGLKAEMHSAVLRP